MEQTMLRVLHLINGLHGVLNDRWREPVPFVDVLHADMLPEDRSNCQCQ
jgi:hypothetical protein